MYAAITAKYPDLQGLQPPTLNVSPEFKAKQSFFDLMFDLEQIQSGCENEDALEILKYTEENLKDQKNKFEKDHFSSSEHSKPLADLVKEFLTQIKDNDEKVYRMTEDAVKRFARKIGWKEWEERCSIEQDIAALSDQLPLMKNISLLTIDVYSEVNVGDSDISNNLFYDDSKING